VKQPLPSVLSIAAMELIQITSQHFCYRPCSACPTPPKYPLTPRLLLRLFCTTKEFLQIQTVIHDITR
jgi:hypothetical protein